MPGEKRGYEPKVDLMNNPAVEFLDRMGYELKPAKVGQGYKMATGSLKDWPSDLEAKYHGVSDNAVVGEKTITGTGELKQEHTVQLIVSPNYNGKDYEFGVFVDGKHVIGNHDDSMHELQVQLRLAEAVATFEAEPGDLPSHTDEYRVWEKNWAK